jgi:hypothetical protein
MQVFNEYSNDVRIAEHTYRTSNQIVNCEPNEYDIQKEYEQLKNMINSAVTNASIKAKFRCHKNGHNCSHNNKVHPEIINGQNNISKIITGKDLSYFNIVMAHLSCSYVTANNYMLQNGINNVTADAYKKQRQRKNSDFMKEIYNECETYRLKHYIKYEKKYMDADGQQIFPVSTDGSKYTLDKNLSKYGAKLYNNNKCTTVSINTLFDNTNGMPLDLGIDLLNSETKKYLEQMNGINDTKYIFIFDRNYYCNEILKHISDNKFNAIFRLKGNYTFLSKFNTNKSSKDKIVYLLNNKIVSKKTCGSVAVRLIKYKTKEDIILCTTLIDKHKYPLKLIINLYKDRWDVELFYKILNFNLKLNYSKSKTINTLMHDIYSKLVIMSLAKLIKAITMKFSSPFSTNEHISFSSCMEHAVHLFFLMLYTDCGYDYFCTNIINLCMNTVKYDNNRQFDRRATRIGYKWYTLQYIAKISKQKVKLNKNNKEHKCKQTIKTNNNDGGTHKSNNG